MVGGWDTSAIDYLLIGKHLAREGYHVYLSELRTGRYDPEVKRRGNPNNWRDWVKDLRSFTVFVMAKHPDAPLFYAGHSFGSLIALAGADEEIKDRRNFRGVIIQSPALPFMLKKQDLIKAAILLPFQGIRVPHLQMGSGVGKTPTGSEELNCRWLCSPDRLQLGYKIRYFTNAAELGYDVRAMCSKIRPPILALAGDKDVAVAPKPRSQEEYRKYLHEELCAGHADVINYPNGYHAMVIPHTGDARLDETSDKVLADMTKWLNRNRTGPQKKYAPRPGSATSAPPPGSRRGGGQNAVL